MTRFLLFGDPATRALLPLQRGRSLNGVSLATAALLLVASSSFAQTGGSYDLTWNTIDGGGATFSTGDGYRVGGTVGQPDAGTLSAGAFALNGGFWGGISAVAASTPTATVTGTVPATHTATATPTVTASINIAATHTPTTVASNAPTPTVTGAPSRTASPTPSATASPTPSPTATTAPVRGDANCDGRDSAADLPALIRNVSTGQRAACGLDDVNDDLRVDDADIEPLIYAVFDEP